MKRALALLAAGLASTGCLFVLNKAHPGTEAIARDPARVARGQYLVDHVANCFSCHPAGNELTEASRFGAESGVVGEVWAPNLSPDTETGLGNWTDGQIVRVVREGVDSDHEALVPVMPYPDYRSLGDEDARCVVAYLRTLPPVRLAAPPRRVEFLAGLLLNLVPKPADAPVVSPGRQDKVAYGRYLATIASCGSCHAPMAPAGPDPTRAFTTPDITSGGIGKWTDDEVKAAITKGELPGGKRIGGRMPWRGYGGLTAEDLDALVAFLRTVPPVADKP